MNKVTRRRLEHRKNWAILEDLESTEVYAREDRKQGQKSQVHRLHKSRLASVTAPRLGGGQSETGTYKLLLAQAWTKPSKPSVSDSSQARIEF
jgi:hypothetical protein